MNRLPVLFWLLVFFCLGLIWLGGCDDATGPLVRPASLGGVVWEGPDEPVEGVAVGLVYNLPSLAAGLSLATETAPPLISTAAKNSPQFHQNFPNPFDRETTFQIDLPATALVWLELFNLVGDQVATVIENEALAAGEHRVTWSSETESALLPNGYYLARLRTIIGETVHMDFVYGLFAHATTADLFVPNDVTTATGEFSIPFPEIASGIRIPRTTADGPTVVEFFVVPTRLDVIVREGGRSSSKRVDLEEMTRWYYLEFSLP
ncbi:MAG: hypothetical protein ABIF77_19590 [bacterium]